MIATPTPSPLRLNLSHNHQPPDQHLHQQDQGQEPKPHGPLESQQMQQHQRQHHGQQLQEYPLLPLPRSQIPRGYRRDRWLQLGLHGQNLLLGLVVILGTWGRRRHLGRNECDKLCSLICYDHLLRYTPIARETYFVHMNGLNKNVSKNNCWGIMITNKRQYIYK